MAEMKYGKAIKKLDDIIRRIESEEVDVDELAVQVKEAVGLIEICRQKIDQADLEVRQVVAQFDDGSAGEKG